MARTGSASTSSATRAPNGLRADAVRDGLEFWPAFKPDAAARLDALGVERAGR